MTRSCAGCLIVTCAVLLSCGGNANTPDASAADAAGDAATSIACGGPPPTIDDCETGVYYYDCGGTGGPTLGCLQHCAWFSTACMPDGWVASDCPIANVCCHPSGAGTWAFPDSWRPEHYGSRAVEEVVALRAAPVTASSPATIAVAIDPSLSAPDAATVTCDPGIELELCQATPVPAWFGDSFGIALNPPRVDRQHATLEVVPTSATTAVGRIFVVLEPDVDLDVGEVPQCEAARGPAQPTVSGSITVSGLSAASPIHGHAELTLNGLPATVVF